jgi:protease I
MRKISGVRVAILVANGFEQVELTEPRRALEDEGALTEIVSPEHHAKAWKFGEWGRTFRTDVLVSEADASLFDALLLPGGVMSPDNLRLVPEAIALVAAFAQAGKPIAAICHGPWILVDAGVVRGKTMTSWPSLRTDLQNAGAEWVDREVVRDGLLVTSRKPGDLPAFDDAMVALFAEPRAEQRGVEVGPV